MVPFFQLPNHICFTPLFACAKIAEHDPSSGDLLVICAATRNARDGSVRDKVQRVGKKTILDFDGRNLGTRDFEGILKS